MKVVYLDHVAKLSGGEIALGRLLDTLATSDRDIERHVILGEDGPLVAKLEETGSTVEVMPLGDEVRTVSRDQAGRFTNLPVAAAIFPYIGALRRRLRQLDPDLVHTNSMKSGLYGSVAGRLARIPVVWHVRDRLAADYMPGHVAGGVRTALRVLPTVVVANSETTLATTGLLEQRDKRSFVLYNPYRATRPPRGAGERDGTTKIGMVGRISPWKGQAVFLEAILELLDQGYDVEARVIGDSMFGEEAYKEAVLARVAQADAESRIRFLGFREDVEAELAELDIAVHASTVPEPYGQVVVEAMAAGVPVVASDAGGPAELIEDGVTGILAPPNDANSLAGALASLIDDGGMRREISERALMSVEKLAPELVAQRMVAIYDRALERSGRRKPATGESG